MANWLIPATKYELPARERSLKKLRRKDIIYWAWQIQIQNAWYSISNTNVSHRRLITYFLHKSTRQVFSYRFWPRNPKDYVRYSNKSFDHTTRYCVVVRMYNVFCLPPAQRGDISKAGKIFQWWIPRRKRGQKKGPNFARFLVDRALAVPRLSRLLYFLATTASTEGERPEFICRNVLLLITLLKVLSHEA